MRLLHAVPCAGQAIENASMQGEAGDAYVVLDTVSAARNAGSPPGREGAPCRARSYPRRSREKLRGLFLGQRLT